jgi:hypothetical protein
LLFVNLIRFTFNNNHQDIYKYSFKEAFLSDPSTYPLIAIMGVAASFAIGMSFNALQYKNVKISPALKHEIIPAETPPRETVTHFMLTHVLPPSFNTQAYKDICYEGLGMNHEEFLKEKEKYVAKQA